MVASNTDKVTRDTRGTDTRGLLPREKRAARACSKLKLLVPSFRLELELFQNFRTNSSSSSNVLKF